MVIPTNYAQVNLVLGGIGLPNGAEMTFGVHNEAPFTADELADVVGDELTAANFDGFITTECQLSSIKVKLGPNSTGPTSELAYVIVGTATGETVAPNTAALISKVTDLGGRQGRGRMYMPGISETSTDAGGQLDAGFAASLQVMWASFRTSMTAAAAEPVLLHGDEITPTLITDFNVQLTLATQRRRLRR